jgi:hypothetical protein
MTRLQNLVIPTSQSVMHQRFIAFCLQTHQPNINVATGNIYKGTEWMHGCREHVNFSMTSFTHMTNFICSSV